MTQQGASRDQLEARVIQRAAADQQFRQDLLSNPRQALEREMGVRLPDNFSMQVVEETPTSFILVLPPAQQPGQQLSASDLEAVAGGWSMYDSQTQCGTCGGWSCAPPPGC